MKVAAFVVGLIGSLLACLFAYISVQHTMNTIDTVTSLRRSLAATSEALHGPRQQVSSKGIPKEAWLPLGLASAASLAGMIGVVGSALVMGGRLGAWKLLAVACPLTLGSGLLPVVMLGVAAGCARSEARRSRNPSSAATGSPTQ